MTSDDAPHQVNNAKKMLAYYAKEREMLRKKLQRARTADEQLGKLEAAVASTEASLAEAQRKGRELLRTQKDQQRLLAAGGSRDESARKLSELREDNRIAKERLRVRTEANEAEAHQIVLAEKRCADLQAGMGELERLYESHLRTAQEAAQRAEAEVAEKEQRALLLEAQAEAEAQQVEAHRLEHQQQRAKARSMARQLKAEVIRLEELLKDVLMERKRGELKAKQASERARAKGDKKARETPREARGAISEVSSPAGEVPPGAEVGSSRVADDLRQLEARMREHGSHAAAAAAAAAAVAAEAAAAQMPPSINPFKVLPQIAPPSAEPTEPEAPRPAAMGRRVSAEPEAPKPTAPAPAPVTLAAPTATLITASLSPTAPVAGRRAAAPAPPVAPASPGGDGGDDGDYDDDFEEVIDEDDN
jgi:chromosome segregation ATPase